MGKIQITCEFNETDTGKLNMTVEDCSANDIANTLRGVFLAVSNRNLVRKGVLLQVLEDIVKEI